MNTDSVLLAATDPAYHMVSLEGLRYKQLTEAVIFQYTEASVNHPTSAYQQVKAQTLEVGKGIFFIQNHMPPFSEVLVEEQADGLLVSSYAEGVEGKLNAAESLTLLALLKNAVFRVFFDHALRDKLFREKAVDYGLEQETDLSSFFSIAYQNDSLDIKPKQSALLPINPDTLSEWKAWMELENPLEESGYQIGEEQQIILVLKRHKYYRHLMVDLYRTGITKEGKVKGPFTLLDPLEQMWTAEGTPQIKFFAALQRFQRSVIDKGNSVSQDMEALRTLVSNPLQYPCYYQEPEASDKVTSSNIQPVELQLLPKSVSLTVAKKGAFYALEGNINLDGVIATLHGLHLVYDYFVRLENRLYLIGHKQVLGLVRLFSQSSGTFMIHERKYPDFRQQVLATLEERVQIHYQYVRKAGPTQLAAVGSTVEKQIYLSDWGNFIVIMPVVRYGEAEIPIRSNKQVHWEDAQGNIYLIKRDKALEHHFLSMLIRQHPFFAEQAEEQEQNGDTLNFFYLHRKRFLDENWFMDVFDQWFNEGVTVFGFKDLQGNRYNPHRAKISIRILSGLNWFNVKADMRFGKQRASLKRLVAALHDKRKYVRLDDGSLGIIPQEWMDRFSRYFNIGEILDEETIGIARTNFALIDEWFDEEQLDEKVKRDIQRYKERIGETVDQLHAVAQPIGLKAKLRDYQQQGLNWLNFLDDLGFGACLADDMGLGKTLQIIAFMLHLQSKYGSKTHLLVVPTTLIFHWQEEFAKFAPSMQIHVHHALGRQKKLEAFEGMDVVLTTYGTMVSDLALLKEKPFDYIFLDESQQIKNPESQRYKAARLLTARNRIVISGTPLENNVFDLFGQLSFVNPGLLGNKKYFHDVYLRPIDQFHDHKRKRLLQQKIKPFILRRTKQEVAQELPEKTEVVLPCNMGAEQRRIYQAYEKEFREYISAITNEELEKKTVHVLRGLTRLRQICDSPVLLGADRLPGEQSIKIDMLMEQIEEKSPNHKILVFSQFVSMLDLIRKALNQRKIGYSYLTGSTRDRAAVVNAFQKEADKRVFLISLKAGGTGLNLTAADYVYLMDPWWNPAVENQAIDRVHRIGQEKHVVAVRLVCTDTLEEKMLTLQQKKQVLFQQLIQPDEGMIQKLSKSDLLSLLNK